VKDVRVAELAARQHNRISRAQLEQLGLSETAIRHRLGRGRLNLVEPGVYAVAPVSPQDEWGRWMAAVLTHPPSVLSHLSAAAAWGFWSLPRRLETVTRPGNRGRRTHGGVLVHHSSTLVGATTELQGVPITTVPRTLLDVAPRLSHRALARCLREALRVTSTTPEALVRFLLCHRGRRGSARLRRALMRYSGLPIHRARSGAEVRALEVLRASGRPLPVLNVRRASEEADLSWARLRLIVEIDGGPFHLDRGEDQRKQRCWESAGWRVRRVNADDVYERPEALLALAPPPNVP
jgi:predicted transcriptional regulator of viral defense system